MTEHQADHYREWVADSFDLIVNGARKPAS